MWYLYVLTYLTVAYILFGICTVLNEQKLIKIESSILCLLYISIWPISLPISIILYVVSIFYHLIYKLWRKIK